MNLKRLTLLVMVAALLVACFGCAAPAASNGGSSSAPPATSGTNPATAPPSGETAGPPETADFSYPIQGDYTLTYFGQFHKKLAGFYESVLFIWIVKRNYITKTCKF